MESEDLITSVHIIDCQFIKRNHRRTLNSMQNIEYQHIRYNINILEIFLE